MAARSGDECFIASVWLSAPSSIEAGEVVLSVGR